MSNILLLYNRKSGRQTPLPVIDEAVRIFERAGAIVEVTALDFEGDPFADIAAIDYVVVAGGDGTIGYVVDRMLHRDIDLPLGIIPIGTANDFATMLGIPHNPRRAAQKILHGSIHEIDCGRVNDRYFVNIFSFGLFATTSQRTLDSRKRRFGRMAYIAEGLRELRHRKAIPLTIKSSGLEFSADILTALVFNGCTAGRLPLARGSRPDDGILDALFLLKRPLWRLMFDAVRHLCGGSPSSVIRVSGQHFTITSTERNILTDVDGQRGPSFPLRIECCPDKIKVVL